MITIKEQKLIILKIMFKGFCGHKLHDVLTAPGTADLTADVDFSYLRRMAEGQVASLGPIKQQTFLKNMGIDVRLKVRIFFTIITSFHFVISHRNVSSSKFPRPRCSAWSAGPGYCVFAVV